MKCQYCGEKGEAAVVGCTGCWKRMKGNHRAEGFAAGIEAAAGFDDSLPDGAIKNFRQGDMHWAGYIAGMQEAKIRIRALLPRKDAPDSPPQEPEACSAD